MPGTPPTIEPLPASVVPDTTRDDELAIRADRRRWLSIFAIAAAIAGVAVGGYLAGRRSQSTPAAPVTAPVPSASVAPSVTSAAPIPPTSAGSLSMTASPSPSALPSLSPSDSAVPPPKLPPRRFVKPKPPEVSPSSAPAASAVPGIETIPPY
jgi:hypothetical protein